MQKEFTLMDIPIGEVDSVARDFQSEGAVITTELQPQRHVDGKGQVFATGRHAKPGNVIVIVI
ncbi:MAG: hypothetical protein LZF61_08750 [Nitrosomonas sp.]|nr:MAG: hypothetical protein LZF61_08750 [Nitrosomonas sp.]